MCACVWGCPWRPTLALPATHAKHALLHAVLGRAVLPAASVPALPGRAAQAVDQRSSWSSGDPLSAPPAPLVVVPAACSRLASRPQHAASMPWPWLASCCGEGGCPGCSHRLRVSTVLAGHCSLGRSNERQRADWVCRLPTPAWCAHAFPMMRLMPGQGSRFAQAAAGRHLAPCSRAHERGCPRRLARSAPDPMRHTCMAAAHVAPHTPSACDLQ